MITRRQFLCASSSTMLISSILSKPVLASARDLPVGLQLFAVRAELEKDYAGTLKRLAEMGFREIEFAGYMNKTAAEILAVTEPLKLRCVGALHSADDIESTPEAILEFANKLNLKYVGCAKPKSLNPDSGKLPWNDYMHSFTLDDWKANAELFNRFGEKARQHGIQFAYHNYCAEFIRIGDITPYDELLRLTDPNVVKIQLDIGWARVGGASPLDILRKYQRRIISLHLKDLKTIPDSIKPESTPNVPLGQGILDWQALINAAERLGIKHYLLEQEPPYVEPIFDSLASSLKYLSTVNS